MYLPTGDHRASLLSDNTDLDLILLSYMSDEAILDMEHDTPRLSLLGYLGDEGRVWHARIYRHLGIDYHDKPYRHDGDYREIYMAITAAKTISDCIVTLLYTRMTTLVERIGIPDSGTLDTSRFSDWDQPVADILLAYLDYHPFASHNHWYDASLRTYDAAVDAVAPRLTLGLIDRVGKIPPNVGRSMVTSWLGSAYYTTPNGGYEVHRRDMVTMKMIASRRLGAIEEACVCSLWQVRRSVAWLYPTFLRAVWDTHGPTYRAHIARFATITGDEVASMGGGDAVGHTIMRSASIFAMAMLQGPSVSRVIIDTTYASSAGDEAGKMDWLQVAYSTALSKFLNMESTLYGDELGAVLVAVPPPLSNLTASLVYMAKEYNIYHSIITIASQPDYSPTIIAAGLMEAYSGLVTGAQEALEYLATVHILWHRGLAIAKPDMDTSAEVPPHMEADWLDWCIDLLTDPEPDVGDLMMRAAEEGRSMTLLAMMTTAILAGEDNLANVTFESYVTTWPDAIRARFPQHVYGLVALRAGATDNAGLLDVIETPRRTIRLCEDLSVIASDLCASIPVVDKREDVGPYRLEIQPRLARPPHEITVDELLATARTMVEKLDERDVDVDLQTYHLGFGDQVLAAQAVGDEARAKIYLTFLSG